MLGLTIGNIVRGWRVDGAFPAGPVVFSHQLAGGPSHFGRAVKSRLPWVRFCEAANAEIHGVELCAVCRSASRRRDPRDSSEVIRKGEIAPLGGGEQP